MEDRNYPQGHDFDTDLEELGKEYNLNEVTLSKLIKNGVKADDLDDFLSMRQRLSRSTDYSHDLPFNKKEDIVSLAAMVRAYQIVEGDLDELSQIVDAAYELASQSTEFRIGMYSSALKEVTDLVEYGEGDFNGIKLPSASKHY